MHQHEGVNARENWRPGLEGVVAAETAISHADGEKGTLVVRGFEVQEFAQKASFEETAFLLWFGHKGGRLEVAELSGRIAGCRRISSSVLTVLAEAAQSGVGLMEALQMGVGMLLVERWGGDQEAAIRVTGAMPTVLAASIRLRQGLAPVEPSSELDHVENFLYMLGADHRRVRVRALETYLNTVVDHGLNASTFTARVIAATGADVVSAVLGAMGALKGPLHGGAPGPVLDNLIEIASPDRAESVLREKLERGERVMGFGHRVYKVRDPRAQVLAAALDLASEDLEDHGLYELAKSVEPIALALLDKYKPGRKLKTNVEFYTALLLHSLGFEPEMFTPIFALSRVLGWTSHIMEQRPLQRIFRPQSRYIGDRGKTWEAV